jgi:hypothetical protein
MSIHKIIWRHNFNLKGKIKMTKKKLDTSFAQWITSEGTTKLSEIFHTTPSTIRNWRLGVVLPRAYQMKRIKELSQGKIDYHHIIESAQSPVHKN